MSSTESLSIHPQELQFQFELNKQISCSLQVSNNTGSYVAFKVKTTNPKKYSVRPNMGIVFPNSTDVIIVTMQPQKDAPADMQCKDGFLIQNVITSPESTIEDFTSDMFNKESGRSIVDEYKLKVNYISPKTVHEVADGGSAPKPCISDNGSLNATTTTTPRAPVEMQHDLTQTKALIYRLEEEKISSIQLNNKLHQEMERLRVEISRCRSAIPFMYIIIAAFMGILFGILFGYVIGVNSR